MTIHVSERARPRDVLAAVSLWIPFLAVVATGWFWRDVLPADVPRQWGADGQVSSTAPTGLTFALIALACLGAAVVALFMLRAGAASSRRPVFLGAGFVAGLSGSIWLTTAGAAVAAGPNGEPRLGAGILLTLLAAGYGVIPFFLSHAVVPSHELVLERMPPRAHPERPLPAAESVEPWSVTITSRLFAGVAAFVVFAVVGAALVPMWTEPVDPGSAVALVAAACVLVLVFAFVLAFVRVRVTVDERGLRVVSWLGIRVKAIPLSAIESVFADDLVPMQWGGWGYRVMPGRSAFILGRGPGLVVQLTNGNQFAISLPDPETPADLLLARLNPVD